jgi:hypothetical protein
MEHYEQSFMESNQKPSLFQNLKKQLFSSEDIADDKQYRSSNVSKGQHSVNYGPQNNTDIVNPKKLLTSGIMREAPELISDDDSPVRPLN